MKKHPVIIKFTVSIFFLLLLVACGRDTEPLENALLGHWETELTDLYFSEDKVISVVKEDGFTIESGYEIISENEEERSLLYILNSTDEDVVNFAETVQFNEDFTKADLIINLEHSQRREAVVEIFAGLEQDYLDAKPGEMIYVDDKQQP